MKEVITIGLDLAKSVFQVHGVDVAGDVVVRKQLRRKQVLGYFSALSPCLVGMEACASAHYWAREIGKLGHEVRLMPPSYVKAYVRRGKTDAADAAAICEAVTRPSMRYVAIKTPGQQSALMAHRTRDLLIRQRTQLINALRGHLAELGVVAAQGAAGVGALLAIVADESDGRVPDLARVSLGSIACQLGHVQAVIVEIERRIKVEHKASERSRRLATVPGIGVISASAIAATVGDPEAFRNGREFAAFLGLVPRQNSSGGKERLGGISKQGDRYLRRLLINGAMAVLRQARRNPGKHPWLMRLLVRRPAKVAAVALANRTARIAWAVLARGEAYRPAQFAAAV